MRSIRMKFPIRACLLYTSEKLLLDGTKFENIYAFENEGLTNILFPFNDSAKLDMGRLAIWRLRLHEQFGGTWFFDYDYISNRLDDFKMCIRDS